jgi:UTP-glucose-1-phosphate uridylyltransferase
MGYLKAIIAFALRHPELKDEFRKHIKEVASKY